MTSLMSDTQECWVCGSPYVECHHIYPGFANRRQSDKYGCFVWLCHEHHVGKTGAHFNKDLELKLKTECQVRWEEKFGDREEFRRVFGKSWL